MVGKHERGFRERKSCWGLVVEGEMTKEKRGKEGEKKVLGVGNGVWPPPPENCLQKLQAEATVVIESTACQLPRLCETLQNFFIFW